MTTPTLTQQLADYQAGFKQRVAPERVAMMEAATADLRATGIEQRALQVGDRAPHDRLRACRGRLPPARRAGRGDGRRGTGARRGTER